MVSGRHWRFVERSEIRRRFGQRRRAGNLGTQFQFRKNQYCVRFPGGHFTSDLNGDHSWGTFSVTQTAHYDSQATSSGGVSGSDAVDQDTVSYGGSFYSSSDSSVDLNAGQSGSFDNATITNGSYHSTLTANSSADSASGMTMTLTPGGAGTTGTASAIDTLYGGPGSDWFFDFSTDKARDHSRGDR
jgi:hypothetical protein